MITNSTEWCRVPMSAIRTCTPLAAIVLAVLIDVYDYEQGYSEITATTISELTEYNTRSIRRAIAELKKQGFIEKCEKKGKKVFYYMPRIISPKKRGGFSNDEY